MRIDIKLAPNTPGYLAGHPQKPPAKTECEARNEKQAQQSLAVRSIVSRLVYSTYRNMHRVGIEPTTQ